MRLSSVTTNGLFVIALGALLASCSNGAQLTPLGAGAAFRARPAATTEVVLYKFTNGADDGSGPWGSPVEDGSGALYGTSSAGSGSAGVVWKLTPSGKTYKKSAIYKFPASRSDGAAPEAGLVIDSSGALYGTTASGGKGSCGGCGVIFKLTPKGKSYTESTLYDFGASSKDGAVPVAALTLSGTKLFGVTAGGGGTGTTCSNAPAGCGTVFEISTKGTGYKVLYDFKGGNDGAAPQSSLTIGTGGVLYGVTANGGGAKPCPAGCGTAFSLTPKAGKYAESVLYRFQGTGGSSPDGEIPTRGRGLYLASDGTLVGTTQAGGTGSCGILFLGGCGIVFTLTPKGKGYAEGTPYTFQGGSDAQGPNEELTPGKNGVLYGTGFLAGGGSACSVGCGAIFSLTPAGSGYKEKVVYSFQGGKDGALPYDGVTIDKSGKLFGTTYLGGGSTTCGTGCGTVFSVTP
jgi:uncharacterized repeat protein (TIGR03803 family)